jgi:hypothetical protein
MKVELDGVPDEIARQIVDIVDRCSSKYPQADLKGVRLYEPKPGDRSLGNEDSHGWLSLNSLWFAGDIDQLRTAAQSEPLWHGPMTEEPRHVTLHEFGHVLAESITGCAARAETLWQAATANPKSAPSRYSLTASPEFVAELFALVEMGFADQQQREDLRWALSG